jgi:hypothetical protein
VVVRGGIVGIIGATIGPIGLTEIEIGTRAEIGIGTRTAMTTETEWTHGETGRMRNEIASKAKIRLMSKKSEKHWGARQSDRVDSL